MKFKINKNKLTIEDLKEKTSGSINYYNVEVEFDSTWDGLTKEARLVKEKEEIAKKRPVSLDNVYIDEKEYGVYCIGFIGYTITPIKTKDTKINKNKKYYILQEGEYVEVEDPVVTDISNYYEYVKNYQISTDLKKIPFKQGAGEFITEESELPSASEWELYMAEIQELLSDAHLIPSGGAAGQVLKKKSNSDYDVEWQDEQGGGSGGTSNYNELTNKPQINGIELTGNKSLEDLGINNFSGDYNDLENKPTIPTVDVNKSYVDTELAKKQEALESGANIKTINNQSILGEGNIEVSGGTVTTGFEGKIFSILGDSISTYTGYTPVADGFNLKHRNRYPENASFWRGTVHDTWWMKVIEDLGGTLGINDSWAGSRVSNSSSTDSGDVGPRTCMASMTRITNLASNGKPDVIMFYGGTNDAGTSATLGTFNSQTNYNTVDTTTTTYDFATAYRMAIQRIRYLYPDAILVSIFPMVTSTYYNMATGDKYIEVVKEICDYFGVLTIDIRKCGINWENKGTYLGDGIHPNEAGMSMMARYIEKELISHYKPLAGATTAYSINNHLTSITTDKVYIKKVVANGSYTATLSSAQGTQISANITMGGNDITATAYNPSTGVITIAHVTGDVNITASAGQLVSYTITNNLTNVTSDNAASSIYEGYTYSATLSPEVHYNIGTVTVTMGGVDITSTAYANGVITIAEVTGNIVITANGAEYTKYTVTYNIPNAQSSDNQIELYEGDFYNTTITANAGYALDSITVTMGGVDVSSQVVTDNNISIASITGNLVITVATRVVATYSITNTLSNVINSNDSNIVSENSPYTATLTAEIGYVISTVTITMGGTDITETAYEDGEISIASVTGDVVITANATALTQYTITNTLDSGITNSNDATSIYENSSYSATLIPDEGRAIDQVTITMGGVDITETAYNNEVITIAQVTGNIVITATSKSGEPVWYTSYATSGTTVPNVDGYGWAIGVSNLLENKYVNIVSFKTNLTSGTFEVGKAKLNDSTVTNVQSVEWDSSNKVGNIVTVELPEAIYFEADDMPVIYPETKPEANAFMYNLAGGGNGFYSDVPVSRRERTQWNLVSPGYNLQHNFGYIGQISTTYEIATTVTNGTYSGATQIREGSTATVTIAANEGYDLPDSVTVTGATYEYVKSTGIITLSNATANVVITAVCVAGETYTEVEYLYAEQNSGGDFNSNQWLITDIPYVSGDIVELDAQADNIGQVMVVSNTGNGSGGSWLGVNGGKWAVGGSGYQSTIAGTTRINATITYTDADVTAVISDGTTTDTLTRTLAGTGTQNVHSFFTMHAFEKGAAKYVTYGFKGKIFSAKIKRNGEYIANLVPAIRDSDNAVGFYETISGRFIYSDDSPMLTAGPIKQ